MNQSTHTVTISDNITNDIAWNKSMKNNEKISSWKPSQVVLHALLFNMLVEQYELQIC